MNRNKRPLIPAPQDDNEPIRRNPTLNKLSIARLGGGIGILGVSGAVVAFLLQRELTGIVFLSLVIGIIGLTVWLSLAPDDLRLFITRRQAVYGGNSVIAIALFAGIVALLYSFANASNFTADLTSFRTYTLRPDVAALVRGIARPAIITVFYNNRNLTRLSQDQPILRMFAEAVPDKIRVNIVDADAQPLIVQKFGASSAQTVFVTEALADGQPDTTAGRIVAVSPNVVGEQQIADALLLLQARGQFRVLFTVGHDEINNKADGGDASAIWNGLVGQGFTVNTIDLAGNEIPKETSAVIMLAPKKDLTAIEADRVARYLDGGGRVLIVAEPNLYINSNAPNPPLEYEFLKDGSPLGKYIESSWGITFDNDIVYDPDPNYFADSQYLLRPRAASRHPILFLDSAGTRQLSGLFTLARSLREVKTTPLPDVIRNPLFTTSDKAFGATQIRSVQFLADKYQRSDKDIAGPFILAYAATNGRNGARLVVFGDSDWLRNDAIPLSGNAALWSNTIDYLSDFTQRTSVSPTVRLPNMSASDGTLNTILVITLIILPGLILAAGAAMWWDRARR